MSAFDYGAKRPDGQHERHPGLPADPAASYVRPLRMSYRHIGVRPNGPTRRLTVSEEATYHSYGYVAYEPYDPPRDGGAIGRYWTERQLKSGCGRVTTMPEHCAVTYARQPNFYGRTFCCECGEYFPVGAEGEFLWIEADGRDGPRVGT